MGATLEHAPQRPREARTSTLRSSFILRSGDIRLCMDPDGASRWLESLSEGRLLFGRESLEFYKVQAGIKVRAQRPDWKLAFSPYSVAFSGRCFDSIDITQSVGLTGLRSRGSIRRTRLRNSGSAPTRIRVVSLHDPTTAAFRSDAGLWGSIGVNAFNRTSHVAMDEVADQAGARVIGSFPPPKSIYMTTDFDRTSHVIQTCEFPDSTAGMSGQILLLMLHEFDLAPQESHDVVVASFYSPEKLEDVLTDFDRVPVTRDIDETGHNRLVCSSEALSFALRWVGPSLEGIEFEPDLLERIECIRGLSYLDQSAARRLVASVGGRLSRDGHLSHSTSPDAPGYLETSAFLNSASAFGLLSGDKKYSKSLYPSLRRTAEFLCKAQLGRAGEGGSGSPQGWRRMIGRGFPTGMVTEVSLSAAGALAALAALAMKLGKSEDSARYVENSELLLDSVRRGLVDENGSLALNIGANGVVHKEQTVDQAVALYRYPFDRRVASSTLHRLQEKDFETGFGPRTVPTSNRVYFNGSYGEGQLGGFWTRAALAHVVLSYASDYAGMASLGLQKLGRLASEEILRFGGSPGTLPKWIDLEKRVVHTCGSDPVAASRMVEAIIVGELGLSILSGIPRIAPATSSSLRWVVAGGVWMGEDVSVFVGRSGGRAFTFAKCAKLEVEGGSSYSGYEWLEPSDSSVTACQFHGPGQLICVGNSSMREVRFTVRFTPREQDFLNHLSVSVEELDPNGESWKKIQTMRVSQSMSVEMQLGPEGWKALRLSTA